MSDLDDLRDRVNKFNALELPGQLQSMHMGTSYLVNDLMRAVDKIVKASRLDAYTSKGYPKAGCERIHNTLARLDGENTS